MDQTHDNLISGQNLTELPGQLRSYVLGQLRILVSYDSVLGAKRLLKFHYFHISLDKVSEPVLMFSFSSY